MKNAKDITFKYYVENKKIRQLFDKKNPENIKLYRLGNEVFLL